MIRALRYLTSVALILTAAYLIHFALTMEELESLKGVQSEQNHIGRR